MAVQVFRGIFDLFVELSNLSFELLDGLHAGADGSPGVQVNVAFECGVSNLSVGDSIAEHDVLEVKVKVVEVTNDEFTVLCEHGNSFHRWMSL